ncbi:MAG: phosphate regulon sensor protein PhoR [Gammaproteobacteria bacterium]
MKRAWRKEFAWATVWFAVAAVLGIVFDCILAALLAAALGYLAWHLANALLMYHRLRGAAIASTPRAWGLWGDIQRELLRLEQTRRDFVSNASHELRTPLTVLHGYLDMIHEDAIAGKDLEPWQKPLGDMQQQSARMEDIVNDMLTLARLESESARAEAERVDVPNLLERLARQADSLSGGQHRIHLDIASGLYLAGQANELQSVFSNLIMNAVQHTPPGSKIDIHWGPCAQGGRFAVNDNGPGIPAASIPRLSERFYRVDVGRSRASGGTGLGLAIVKHALERHDSALEVESAAGAGATFSCVFPPRRVVVDT